MDKNVVSNPNDFKVVEFYNSTNFDFTPDLGAMYDGRPLFVGSGEKKHFPYHVGHRLAVNLAKAVLIKGAPLHDPNSNNQNVTPLWGDEKVRALENSFITELFSDDKPVVQSETDRLMARVADLEKAFNLQKSENPDLAKPNPVKSVEELVTEGFTPNSPSPAYKDKQEVIAELEKREIKHDKRMSKEALEKLLA